MSNATDEKMVFRIATKNVGPLQNSPFQLTDAKNKKRFCIYANNGSGKTILSRCFSLSGLNTESQQSELHYLYPHLIKLNETSFEFEFRFSLSTETDKILKISGNKFNEITITNGTGYIFYVFNEDFVKKNIREKKYQIDSNIEGYIIGNSAINLDKQNNNLEILKNSKDKLENVIAVKIKKLLNELSLFAITKNTTEYKEINFDRILREEKFSVSKSFDEYVAEHNKLKSLPDNIPFVEELREFIIDDFSSIIELLSHSYTLNSFSESFKKDVLSKLEFIQNGLSLSNGKTCPFCGQEYSLSAIDLINEYNKFVNDGQTKIISQLKTIKQTIDNIPSLYRKYLLNVASVQNDFRKTAEYFPDLKGLDFADFKKDSDLSSIIESISLEIERKIENISLSIDLTKSMSDLKIFEEDTYSIRKQNNILIQRLNKSLSNINSEKLSIKRNLCKSAFNNLFDDISECVRELKTTKEQISAVTAEIKKLQETVQIKKKNLIATTLKELLKSFFGDKYEFDEENFKFKLLNCDVTNDLDYVLSEAEKNIIGFCYYIASIFYVVENEDDLKRVFYVIDDPVSSMDFLYVYNVATIINNYCKKKYGTNVLLLTHNLEFFNIVLKNGLIDVGVSLHNGVLKKSFRQCTNAL